MKCRRPVKSGEQVNSVFCTIIYSHVAEKESFATFPKWENHPPVGRSG